MKHLFGPVASRRLGLSLGVELHPPGICSFDCVYCEAGRTTEKSIIRQAYYPYSVILDQIQEFLRSESSELDYITFSGSGEPTLYSEIAPLIHGIKKLTDIPVCLLTNGSLFWDKQVRRDVLECDVIIPSLDSAMENTFKRLNRPHPAIALQTIMEGLVLLREEFSGSYWLEILLVQGINDTEQELTALEEAIQRIQPDRLYLNTIFRPAADKGYFPVPQETIEQVNKRFTRILKEEAVLAKKSPRDQKKWTKDNLVSNLMRILDIRPQTLEDMQYLYQWSKEELQPLIQELEEHGLLKNYCVGREIYYIKKRDGTTENSCK